MPRLDCKKCTMCNNYWRTSCVFLGPTFPLENEAFWRLRGNNIFPIIRLRPNLGPHDFSKWNYEGPRPLSRWLRHFFSSTPFFVSSHHYHLGPAWGLALIWWPPRYPLWGSRLYWKKPFGGWGPTNGPDRGPTWVKLEPTRARHGLNLSQLWAILDPSRSQIGWSKPAWSNLEAILRPFGAHTTKDAKIDRKLTRIYSWIRQNVTRSKAPK